MGEYLVALTGALLLGIQTSISPCPLATNIAAISYVGRRIAKPRQVFWAGLLYTIGRTVVYLGLGACLVAGLLSVPWLSMFLQKYMDQILGPFLILLAMVLLELITVDFSGGGISEKMQQRVDSLGVWGAGLLGIVFALAFCPVSAFWFFFGLIPLAIKFDSSVVMPSIYGVGTALPVIVFAAVIAFGSNAVGKTYNAMARIEWWVKRITALILLAIGIHYSVKCAFGIAPFWDPWVQAAMEAYARIVPSLRGGT